MRFSSADGQKPSEIKQFSTFDTRHGICLAFPFLVFSVSLPSSNLFPLWSFYLPVRAGQGQENDNIPSFSGQIRSAATCAPANTLR